MSKLTEFLGISRENAATIAEGAEEVKTATEFLTSISERLTQILDGTKSAAVAMPLLGDIITKSLPWVEQGVTTAGELVPPVKAIVGLLQFLTRETDPNALGLLAFSLAYQASAAEAAMEIEADPERRQRIARELPKLETRQALIAHEPENVDAFAGFRINSALSHALMERADKALGRVAATAGYPDDLQLLLIEGVHKRFAEKFRSIISDGSVREKFDPLFRLIALQGNEFSTHAAVLRHIEYQIWRYENAPALGAEGSMSVSEPLCRIYVPLDCGVLRWGEVRRGNAPTISKEEPCNPFDEKFGGRHDLLGQVIDFIGDPKLADAIIIQGVAGSGKSAFTQALCSEIRKLGLRPLRIRMRDLSHDSTKSLIDDLASALVQNCGDDNFDEKFGPRPSLNDIDIGPLLDESVPFRGARICPVVFIFDGWDEISISASEGFRIRIEKTLNAIRQQMLSGRSHRVRIILTGRPSEDVSAAKFLQAETPILTVRPFTQEQLAHFANTLLEYRQTIASPDNPTPTESEDQIKKLLVQHEEEEERGKGQGILGIPLLALLAVWLILNDKNPPQDMLVERASLYRRLADLTCRHGGNVISPGERAARVKGTKLRELLHHTAAAMTLRGTENISYEEWTVRLNASGFEEPDSIVEISENPFASFMLSFFLTPGVREHGCEFLHKSFREYFFAEAIVETLKVMKNNGSELHPRHPYWKQFEESDPRSSEVYKLAVLLAPQWLSPDVARHLLWLIRWEIGRAQFGSQDWSELGETAPITMSDWELIRDRLADFWDWWAEGVHLRPQPFRPRGRADVVYQSPFAVLLAEQLAPIDLPKSKLPEPVRVTTIDSHLGDALFRLNCCVHFEINKATGWLDLIGTDPEQAIVLWQREEASVKSGRPYQTRISHSGKSWYAFAPGAPHQTYAYLEEYFSRIDSAGWRPLGSFPRGVDMRGVDLSNCKVEGSSFVDTDLSYSSIKGTWFYNCIFGGNVRSLISLFGPGAKFLFCQFNDTFFENSYFDGCEFFDVRFVLFGRSIARLKAFIAPEAQYELSILHAEDKVFIVSREGEGVQLLALNPLASN